VNDNPLKIVGRERKKYCRKITGVLGLQEGMGPGMAAFSAQ
jgi:hypothetical protein